MSENVLQKLDDGIEFDFHTTLLLNGVEYNVNSDHFAICNASPDRYMGGHFKSDTLPDVEVDNFNRMQKMQAMTHMNCKSCGGHLVIPKCNDYPIGDLVTYKPTPAGFIIESKSQEKADWLK